MRIYKKQKAYITVVTVITISAVSIAVVLSLIFSSLGMITSSQSLKNLAQAEMAANSCIEEALERIRQDNTYQTSFTLTETNYSCQADINQISSTQFEIQSTGISGDSYKKIRVETSQITPIVTISLWEEVSDF
jgi:type II secretory pathway pseudopilin PulG